MALVVAESARPGVPVASASAEADPHTFLATLSVAGLEPDTSYDWAIRAGGRTSSRSGRIVTAPARPKTFTFALGACGGYRRNASSDVQFPMSTHPVWDTILEHRPAFFLHLGDLHYQDVDSPDEDDHLRPYFDVLSSGKQGRLWRLVPMAHMWSDHDFCGNNSFSGSAGRGGALAAYRKVTPQLLGWPAGDHPVSFAFDWGPRVRIIVPDCRSARSRHSDEDGPAKSILGSEGKAWLIDQLDAAERSADVALIGLYTEVPWISSDCDGGNTDGDDWSAYAVERAEIASYLDENVTKQILGLAGDAHMNAFDDGTNNEWGGFPVLHTAALARSGSVKGGPYTVGTFPNTDVEGEVGQFALVTVKDDGSTMNVEVSGRRVTTDGAESVQFTETIEVPPPPG